MAPLKFEENMREKLRDRELKPSPEAWKKLDAALGPEPKKRPAYLWWAIAASLVTLFILGGSLLSDTPSETIPVLTEEPGSDVELEGPAASDPTEILSEEIKSEDIATGDILEAPDMKIEGSAKTTEFKSPNPVKEETTPIVDQGSKLAEVTDIVPKDEQNPDSPKIEGDLKQDDFIQGKVDEVVAKLQLLEEQESVSPEEIDALLFAAQREISNKKILDPATARVDPNALLMEVELDIERSFRDRVFETLGEGFNKVRTAMADRNN